MLRIPSLLCSLAAFAAAFAVTPTAPAAALARGHTKFLGCCYSAPQTSGFASYFNQVVPENGGKWGSVEGTRNVMNWTDADAAYNFAKSNGLPFRYHVLIWGGQQPAWIENLPAADQLEEIKQWMDAVAARYPAIDYLEVVNEPTRQPPIGAGHGNYINALGGNGATGWDWVLTAFRLARARFPATTKFVLNDYGVTNDTTNLQKYIGIVNLLKAENLVDIIAVQAHYFSTRSYSGNLPQTSAQTKSALDALGATGVPIMITEMDIDGVTPNTTPALQDDALQLSEYKRIFPIFWEHPSVMGMTLWGFRPGLWRNNEKAYLLLDNGTERPAMQWLRTYLDGIKPVMTTQPQDQAVVIGGGVTLTAAATSTPAPALQWRRNGADVSGATSGTLALNNVQPADTGLYTAAALGVSATTVSSAAIVGLTVTSPTKVVGAGREIGTDIKHPNGNTFDQVGLEGAAEAITADYDPDPLKNQITRTSFIDLDNDIVQVEFSGPGTLSLVLEGATGPAAPVNYNQAATYMKGHVGIVITGATEQTNVSVFSVGRVTAVNQALFKPEVTYDGIADLAFIAITSTNGKFGGLRTSNANYFATKGLTGVYAPGVAFGVVFIGNITAFESATPVIQVGSVGDARITGGDLQQANNAAVQVSGITQLKFTAGSDSHGTGWPAKTNKAVLQDSSGNDVTAQIVTYP